jgi:hypothetical protein
MSEDSRGVPGVMRKMWRATIWHPNAISLAEGETSREMKRYVVPLSDALRSIMGFTAVNLGMPSFDIMYNSFISTVAAWTLLGAAITALVGLAFPRLWVAEAVGKLLMLIVLVGYAAALWVLVAQGGDTRGVVAAAFTGLLFLPMWNLQRIGREWRARQAARKAA